MIGTWLFLLSAPAACDSLVRAGLIRAARARSGERKWVDVRSWLVLVPARDEGRNVEATVRSLRQSGGDAVTILVILDGPDDLAAEICGRYGVAAITKEPVGPSKAAVLRWVGREHPELVLRHDAVMLVDCGSVVSADFFAALRWPEGADAIQALLLSSGEGAGQAAAASEQFAQQSEDRGREALGWNVRLRGTGTAMRPSVFMDLAPELRTQVEDLEASLILAADGLRLTLADGGAFIIDEKPAEKGRAAVQRARWLAGKFELITRRPADVWRLVARRPLEGMAFAAELFGRPLSLTVPLRAGAAAVLFVEAARHGGLLRWAGGSLLLGSAALDVVHLSRKTSPSAALELALAWAGAAALSPRALFRWMKARR